MNNRFVELKKQIGKFIANFSVTEEDGKEYIFDGEVIREGLEISTYDENGVFNGISFKNDDTFNFAFDCVDAIAEKNPDKLAMMWVGNDKSERRFTFNDMKELIYRGKKTRPLSERSGSQPSNLSTFLPLKNPNFSNTAKGASVFKTLTFILPVLFIVSCE